MPRNGVSSEWVGQREDEIARIIDAKDRHLAGIRTLADVLHRRGLITADYYHDICDSADAIAQALLVAKRNTAHLRNNPPAS